MPVMRTTIPRLRASRQFVAAVAAILLMSGAVSPKALMAQEDGANPFDAISDLFPRPDNGTVNVPDRRHRAPALPAPARDLVAPPADVYRNALSIPDELELVAAMRGTSLSFELPQSEQEVAPADVVAQILRATYKAITLQTRLQMESSRVPETTLMRVSPSENYCATNLLLAEIARIKVHLGVTVAHADRPILPTDQQSKDVFALVNLTASNIDRVAAAVGN